MADHRRETGRNRRRRRIGEALRHEHRKGPLARVQAEGRDRDSHAARAQHVGGADIPAPGLAQVDAAPPRQQQRERHGAGQISKRDRDKFFHTMTFWS